MRKVRRSFSDEFKAEAVRQVTALGRPISQVAHELSLRPEQLRGWKKKLVARGATAAPVRIETAEDEVRRLRRELAVLRQEHEFMEKRRRSSPEGQHEVRRGRSPSRRVPADPDVSCARCRPVGLLRLAGARVLGADADGCRAPRPDCGDPCPVAPGVRCPRTPARVARDGPRHLAASDTSADAGGAVCRAAAAALAGHDACRRRAAGRPESLGAPVHGRRAQSCVGGRPDVLLDADGWLYLAVVLDLCSRRVVGWATGRSPDAEVALLAWQRATALRQPAPGLLHHSDRGSSYACRRYQAALATQ